MVDLWWLVLQRDAESRLFLLWSGKIPRKKTGTLSKHWLGVWPYFLSLEGMVVIGWFLSCSSLILKTTLKKAMLPLV